MDKQNRKEACGGRNLGKETTAPVRDGWGKVCVAVMGLNELWKAGKENYLGYVEVV